MAMLDCLPQNGAIAVQLTGAQHNIQCINIKGSNADLKKKKVSNKHLPAAEVCS